MSLICSALGDRNLSLLGYDTNIILSHNIHAIKIEITIVFIVQRRKIRPREVKMFIQSEAADEASLQSDFVSKIRAFICLQIHSYLIFTPLGATSVSSE